MILSGSLYLLVTLGQLFVGCGSVYQVISFIFTGGTDAGSSLGYHVCYTIISVFILISILGVTNSLSMAVVFSAQAILDEEILAGSKKFKKWGNGRKNLAGYIVVWLFAGTMLLVYGIPSIILNTDQIMDGLSNLPVLAFFTIYGIVAIGSAINRFTHRVKVYPIPLQSPIAIIGGVGCIVIALYAIIYTFCVDSILHATSTDTGWGLFLHNGWGNEQFALNK
jgi:hypothetical protein